LAQQRAVGPPPRPRRPPAPGAAPALRRGAAPGPAPAVPAALTPAGGRMTERRPPCREHTDTPAGTRPDPPPYIPRVAHEPPARNEKCFLLAWPSCSLPLTLTPEFY